tara:strand:+ start:5062 stop:5382 length:321 start_codon:yes stop_codon:yes gene_type:complete
MRIFFLLFFVLNFLHSCGSVGEGFTLKKSNAGDEFLVEKKNPLVLPPSFNELPEPGKLESMEKGDQNSFEEKITIDDSSDIEAPISSASETTEEFILKNIKKNESN